MPRLLSTADPLGKPWKKLGTPEATYEGMLDPNPERTESISLVRSESTSLRDFAVLVGSHVAGEGVISGCS